MVHKALSTLSYRTKYDLGGLDALLRDVRRIKLTLPPIEWRFPSPVCEIKPIRRTMTDSNVIGLTDLKIYQTLSPAMVECIWKIKR